MRDFVIGIDTGGTYTDGVLLDFESREVLKTTKVLTTHHDLRICILDGLDAILPAQPEQVRVVSISTTLATNAIAEGRGRPAALLLLGYDRELIQRFNLAEKLGTAQTAFIEGGHTLAGEEQRPLDRSQVQEAVREFGSSVEAFAVSGYFSPFNPAHELEAAGLISALHAAPVVQGHQLSSRLNSVQRAATAALNASLLSILQQFIDSMQAALNARGLRAPLMIMRGDGALVRAEYASHRPVETVHSGPAASAIGARTLAGVQRALMIDIGGTTTDLAIIDNGQVAISEGGTTVGPYQTAIRAARVRSFGLGGDSLIDLDVEDHLQVGPERVMPLAQLAAEDAFVARSLAMLGGNALRKPSPEALHYWYLRREPKHALEEKSRKVVEMLRQHALPVRTVLERIGVLHPIQVGGPKLIREDVIGLAALTPTDLLHLSGEYAPWSKEAAGIASEFFARLLKLDAEALGRLVKAAISERIIEEIVAFLTGVKAERGSGYATPQSLGSWLFEEHLSRANAYLGSQISLKLPIVGIGAPAGIYLPAVAESLRTTLILPEHYPVANAIGAVAGSVIVREEAWILPSLRGLNVLGYSAKLGEDSKLFASLDEAADYAQSKLEGRVASRAQQAGANEAVVTFEQIDEGADSLRIRATAVGNPRLDRGG